MDWDKRKAELDADWGKLRQQKLQLESQVQQLSVEMIKLEGAYREIEALQQKPDGERDGKVMPIKGKKKKEDTKVGLTD